MTIEYTNVADYYFPNINENQEIQLSKYSRMKLKHLKEYHQGLYFKLLSTNQLNNYLQNIDMEANELYERLLIDFKKQRGITEELKGKNQMQWVQEMNNIQNCIHEMIRKEFIEF